MSEGIILLNRFTVDNELMRSFFISIFIYRMSKLVLNVYLVKDISYFVIKGFLYLFFSRNLEFYYNLVLINIQIQEGNFIWVLINFVVSLPNPISLLNCKNTLSKLGNYIFIFFRCNCQIIQYFTWNLILVHNFIAFLNKLDCILFYSDLIILGIYVFKS